jgi:DNA-binding MarR family transcriptional regulator
MSDLRFNGSVWCNIEIALHTLDYQLKNVLAEYELSTIQAYILWALLDQDGQRASHLAQAVGRVATSFTPLLDSLEQKNLLKRTLSASDRRVVFIHLTPQGRWTAGEASKAIQSIDSELGQQLGHTELSQFLSVILTLQTPSKLSSDATANNT